MKTTARLRIAFVPGLTLALLAGSAYAGNAAPNLAGTWSFDSTQSKNVGMMAQGTITTTITQSKKEIVADDDSVFQGQSSTQHTVYDLTGKAVTNVSLMAGQATTHSHWDGGRLVTEWESPGAIAGSLTRRTETRYLSADGKTMYVESARQGRESMLMVFVRGR